MEEGFRHGKSHAYRMRCRVLLLKSQGLTSKEIGVQTEMTHISVTHGWNTSRWGASKDWRHVPDEVENRSWTIQMRKAVRRAIGNDRQSVKKAKEARQQASGKEA